MRSKPDESDVAAALARWREGDGGAFGEIYSTLFPSIREIVHIRLGGTMRLTEDSIDVVQDVFLSLFRSPPPSEIREVSELKSYLATAVGNRLTDLHRRDHQQKRDRGREVSPEDRSRVLREASRLEPTPSEVSMGHEVHQRYCRAVSALSEKEREAVILSRHVGISAAQAATSLRMESPGAFRALLSRALSKVTLAMQGQP